MEANRDETEAFEARYGRVDIEDAKVSVDARIFGSLREAAPEGGSGGSKGEAWLRGVMKTSTGSCPQVKRFRFVAQWLGACAATCAWIETKQLKESGLSAMNRVQTLLGYVGSSARLYLMELGAL